MSIFSSNLPRTLACIAARRTPGFWGLKLVPRLGAVALALGVAAPTVQAGTEDYLGELTAVAFNFCPRGTLEANGQLLSVQSYAALFSLLGIQFGGDGTRTFALPNLQGRVPVGRSTGNGLSRINLGDTGGAENVTLTQGQMPAHTHALRASQEAATHATPSGATVLAQTMNAGAYGAATGSELAMAGTAIGVSGGNQPFSVRDPYVGMLWCITTEGNYPWRP